MRATSVICRFLSLLDVTLILLGLLMVVLTQAQLRSNRRAAEASPTPAEAPPTATAASVQAATDFVYLYAGTHGAERGKCYQLGPRHELVREVRTDVPDDLQLVLQLPAQATHKPNRVAILLISDRGFDSMWGPERLAQMERDWGLPIVPVYNVRIESQ